MRVGGPVCQRVMCIGSSASRSATKHRASLSASSTAPRESSGLAGTLDNDFSLYLSIINQIVDLNLDNIACFSREVPGLLEVSIGHALICESLYLGLENVIALYKKRLNP